MSSCRFGSIKSTSSLIGSTAENSISINFTLALSRVLDAWSPLVNLFLGNRKMSEHFEALDLIPPIENER